MEWRKKEEGIIGEDWGRVGLGKMKGVIGDGGVGGWAWEKRALGG